MKITVFLGPPGSGKGTQAKLLASNGSVQHVSTGDLFRKVIREGSKLGTKLKGILDSGELVPDSLTLEVLSQEIKKLPPTAHSVILDGYPRNVEQARALDHFKDMDIGSAIYFEMPQAELLTRLSGRRICKNCGETYHLQFSPPKKANHCDKCEGELYQRADDQQDVVQKRLSIYEQQTSPLLEYYRSQGKLRTVHADNAISKVHGVLTHLISS